MKRTAFGVTALLALLSVTACSSASSDDNAGSNIKQPPAGCAKTLCDAKYDRCENASSDLCSQCHAECYAPNVDIVLCESTCDDICSQPVHDHCPDSDGYCRSSEANTFCIDEVPPAAIPSGLPLAIGWRPPHEPQSACSEKEIEAFEKKCLGSGSSQAACKSAVSAKCGRCLIEEAAGAEALTPFLITGDGDLVMVNVGGCAALVDGDSSRDGCGYKVFAAAACELGACDRATNDSMADCTANAVVSACKPVADKASACAVAYGDTLDAACGADSDDGATVRMKIARTFCAAPKGN